MSSWTEIFRDAMQGVAFAVSVVVMVVMVAGLMHLAMLAMAG